MRLIVKSKPEWFTRFMKHNVLHDWDVDMPADKKCAVRECILKNEQNFYSAYTEKRLSLEDKSLHIDHFYKQALFPKKMFEWSNLFVAKHDKDYGADFKDSKLSPIRTAADYQKMIDPQQEDPHHYFCYMVNGDIECRMGLSTTEKEKAEFTINAFNLKHASLSNEREQLICLIRNLKEEGCNATEIKELLKPNSSYPSVIEYYCDEVFDAL